MQQQKNIATLDVEDEVRHHAVLTAELAELTDMLKSATLNMSESIGNQNLV
jgi:hypothetical protein